MKLVGSLTKSRDKTPVEASSQASPQAPAYQPPSPRLTPINPRKMSASAAYATQLAAAATALERAANRLDAAKAEKCAAAAEYRAAAKAYTTIQFKMQRAERAEERLFMKEEAARKKAALTPEQKLAAAAAHNDQRLVELKDYDVIFAWRANMTLEAFKEFIAPVKADLVTKAKHLLSIIETGETEWADLLAAAFLAKLKGKSTHIDSRVIYYAATGAKEKDASKLKTFIARMAY